MSRKTGRAAKLAESTLGAGSTSPAALPPPAASPSIEVTLPGQPTLHRTVEFKFAEGSSFLSLPREEQERMVRYLLAYRKELPRLLGEGESGRFAVIQGDEVAHVWDTADDAMQAATLFFGADQFGVYQVRPQDVDRLAWGEEAKGSPCPR